MINRLDHIENRIKELDEKIIKQFPTLQLIASGGVSQLLDLQALRTIGCSGAIVGKAIYENKMSLKELSDFNVL
jgi:phosphoribosylformimino-5-aminoimidazole carboxamide ribotide isomerase